MAKAIGPRRAHFILDNHRTFQHILRANTQAPETSAESAKPIRLTLPPALKEHTQTLQDGHVLVLIASNNAVAQILRFHAPRLAKQAGLNEWYVKVSRFDLRSQQTEKALPQATLCAKSAQALRTTAAQVKHKGLQEALLRLASNAN